GIPLLADLRSCVIGGNAREITFCRCDHSPSPVFGNNGNPVACDVKRRRCPSRLRSLLPPPATLATSLSGLAENIGQSQSKKDQEEQDFDFRVHHFLLQIPATTRAVLRRTHSPVGALRLNIRRAGDCSMDSRSLTSRHDPNHRPAYRCPSKQ